MVFYNLKSLIKAIRATKTIADERALIIKESASIRTNFKTEDVNSRHDNVAKLLYIHMLGYPAHFGQIESLKLVASPRFADKRLGYCAIMLLLDENHQVLTLVTNSLKNDINHSNPSTVSLALSTFANIASEEMARDLVNEIEKSLGSSNAYIRKKAALAALRCLYKVPELVDHFESRATSLLSDRNHGVLLTGVTLVIEMCRIVGADPFRKAVPLLVRHLKALVTTGYSPEHDVSGITDPFLQVKILRLLRMLGKDDLEASDAMNDILAQVATNTESAKNVGNSILYEAVLTILEIQAESGLRVMAINILGKFLGNRDNNIRYVALNTLNKVVLVDTAAVQRHRTIILDCLRDGDISIRRRALELSYALINEGNIRVLTRELLTFLEVADNEFKFGITTRVCEAAERFAPNKRWHIDTVLRVLKLAGNFVKEEVLSNFIRLLTQATDLQSYAVYKLYGSLKADVSQESLTLAGVWVIGEFGDVLLSNSTLPEEIGEMGGEEVTPAEPKVVVTEVDVLDLMEKILVSPYTNNLIRQFVLVSMTKLSTRFTSSVSISRIRNLLHGFDNSIELELQSRAIEFGKLLDLENPSIKIGVLERMPMPEVRKTVMGSVAPTERKLGRKPAESLLDLMGDDSSPAATSTTSTKQSTQDLLADIFGSSNDESATSAALSPSTSNMSTGKSSVNDILGLFDSTSISSTPMASVGQVSNSSSGSIFDVTPTVVQSAPIAVPQVKSFVAYESNGLKITLEPKKDTNRDNVLNVLVRFEAIGLGGGDRFEEVGFMAAVPKTQKLQMLASSSSIVTPGKIETQQLRIMVGSASAQIRLRLRIAYKKIQNEVAGELKSDQTDFTFPEGSMA